MKLKYKLILDALMFLAIWIVMSYRLTGNLLHEVTGIALILCFLSHLFLNRRYYVSMTKALLHSKVKCRSGIAYGMNVVLLVATAVMAISSVVISKDLFSFLGLGLQNFFFWQNLHVLSAVVILICVFAHVLLHAPMLSPRCRKGMVRASQAQEQY